jgi:hypothetical protein
MRMIECSIEGRKVGDLIVLVEAVDGILQLQAQADNEYFINWCERSLTPTEAEATASSILAAYRWQYIVSGMAEPRFSNLLRGLVSDQQWERINHALSSVMQGNSQLELRHRKALRHT